MFIRNKSESLLNIQRLGLNFFPERVFNPNDKKLKFRIQCFVEENNAELYVLRDYQKCQGNAFFNICKNAIFRYAKKYSSCFSVAVSSKNYGRHVLIGDIYISKTLDTFMFFASDNPNYSTRDVLKNPKWNFCTDYYDNRIKHIPNINKIIDYVFKYNLFDVIVEFAVYPHKVGKNNEYVVIFELRTEYWVSLKK